MIYYCNNISLILVLSSIESIISTFNYLSVRFIINQYSKNQKLLAVNHSHIIMAQLCANTLGSSLGGYLVYNKQLIYVIILIIVSSFISLIMCKFVSSNIILDNKNIPSERKEFNFKEVENLINVQNYSYSAFVIFGCIYTQYLVAYTQYKMPGVNNIYSLILFSNGIATIIGIYACNILLSKYTISSIIKMFYVWSFLWGTTILMLSLMKANFIIIIFSFIYSLQAAMLRKYHNFILCVLTPINLNSVVLGKSNSLWNAAALIGNLIGAYMIQKIAIDYTLIACGVVIMLLSIFFPIIKIFIVNKIPAN